MRLEWFVCLTLASTGLAQSRAPSATGEALNAALKGASQPFSVTAQGELADAGGMLIKDAVDRAHFVLLGESHFSRETPQFAAAVCKQCTQMPMQLKQDLMPRPMSRLY